MLWCGSVSCVCGSYSTLSIQVVFIFWTPENISSRCKWFTQKTKITLRGGFFGSLGNFQRLNTDSDLYGKAHALTTAFTPRLKLSSNNLRFQVNCVDDAVPSCSSANMNVFLRYVWTFLEHYLTVNLFTAYHSFAKIKSRVIGKKKTKKNKNNFL